LVRLVRRLNYHRLDAPSFEQVALGIAQLEQILNVLLATRNGKDWVGGLVATGKAGT
jgi:hypothetical protein